MKGRTRLLVLAAIVVGSSRLSALELSSTPPQPQPSTATQTVPPSIVELQPLRRVTSMPDGTATLIELNPNVNTWLVLDVAVGGGRRSYHLENPDPDNRVSLDESGGLRLWTRDGAFSCPLWSAREPEPLEAARRSGLPFAPLCQGRLYLRNTVAGTYTRLEGITNFLRDHVWGGDRIVNFVREEFYRDAFLEKGRNVSSAQEESPEPSQADAPLGALLDAAAVGESIAPENLGLDARGLEHGLMLGIWYPVNGVPGVYVSAVRPSALAASIASSFRDRVARLDAIESDALDYLVGFDLAQFDLGFALGTDHPRVEWSGRELPQMHDARLPGPDGIADTAPLTRTGMLSPVQTVRAVATFAGGFKREHGAFHYGPLAYRNHGSHYGFIEEGVVFSKLLPGLATLYMLNDGTVGMKTWAESDDSLLNRVRYARQNGVALIETVPSGGAGIPGPFVAQWGAGNWSGSAAEQLRSLRAGVCLQQTPRHPFLIYGYFSTATPSAMARVFQAYQCQYAMHLDMNALEHTYLAVYARRDGKLLVQHLIQGMAEVDRKGGDQWAPRFLSFPDDRDFFYVLRRGPAAAAVP